MCWKCKNNVQEAEPVGRGAECPVCHADLHSCRNCVYYAPGSHYDCHETVEDPVADKERANFCGNFRLRREWGGSSDSGWQEKSSMARSAFDALFSV